MFAGLSPAAGSLAVLAGLSHKGWRVQHYGTRACLDDPELVRRATGLPGRHLDPWLMPPPLLRAVFVRSAAHVDLAVVEGTLDPPVSSRGGDLAPFGSPGDLAPVAEALSLPRVGLVPGHDLELRHLPRLDPRVDAVIIDGLGPGESFDAVREALETIARRPVLGAVPALPAARAALADMREAAAALDALAHGFLKTAQLGALRALAQRGPALPSDEYDPLEPSRRPFRVAYARDDAFTRYFPDTLETLEAVGAELVEFSPLRDERLPERIDLLILGCGYTERHAEALGANLSMVLALRAFVSQGRRLYAEGGGMAYLGREMRMGGRSFPMAGIFPFVAELLSDRPQPHPVERSLTRRSWLGPRGTSVRGYHAGRWAPRPAPTTDEGPAIAGPLSSRGDIYFRRQAIGSLVHLHLAALPQVLARFIETGDKVSSCGPPMRTDC